MISPSSTFEPAILPALETLNIFNISADPLTVSLISDFIHYIFVERQKSEPLNWCFANIKRAKIFLQIFHSNQSGKEIYKEEIAKNLSEYSYKTIAKIIDDGIGKKYFVSNL